MSRLIPWVMILGGIFLATIRASADIIIPVEPHRIYRSSLTITLSELPLGYELLCIDEKGKIIDQTKGKKSLTIDFPCTIYGIGSNELSKPFSLQEDKGKLLQLRVVGQDEIPTRRGEHPRPGSLTCDITGTRQEDYAMICDKRPPPTGGKWSFPPHRLPVKP